MICGFLSIKVTWRGVVRFSCFASLLAGCFFLVALRFRSRLRVVGLFRAQNFVLFASCVMSRSYQLIRHQHAPSSSPGCISDFTKLGRYHGRPAVRLITLNMKLLETSNA